MSTRTSDPRTARDTFAVRTPELPCRVCKSHQADWLCDTPNSHSATRVLSHFRCRDCGSVFVGQAVDHAELGVAYASLDSSAYYREITAENTRKMHDSIGDLVRLGCRGGALLDIGTGDGMFVPLLRNAGFDNVSVHEIEGADLSGIAHQVKAVYQDHDYSTLPDAAFDTVTLLDVAEHVIDPLVLMKTAHRVLRTGGVVYIHTPVVTRTDRFMHALQKLPLLDRVGRMWQAGRTSIFHLQNYTAPSLEQVLRQAGFAEVEVRVVNELSWPLSRYVHVYLLKRLKLPAALAPVLAPLFWPILASRFFNANKGVAVARKVETPSHG